MEFESVFQLNWDEDFSLFSQPMPCSPVRESLSSASSAYVSLTPISKKLRNNVDDTYQPFRADHNQLGSPFGQMSEIMSKGQIKVEEHLSFNKGVSSTLKENAADNADVNSSHTPELNLVSKHSSGFTTSTGPFPTSTISLAALELNSFMAAPMSVPTWTCSNERVEFPPPQHGIESFEFEATDMAADSQLAQDACQLHQLSSPGGLRVHEKMVMPETTRKAEELQCTQYSTCHRIPSSDPIGKVGVAILAIYKCDYPRCRKAFRRSEHLQRHKQTFHGQGPNRFSCEFCGKNQFNRQDNLNTHRKLHARLNSSSRGVIFMPAAVPIIEQEQGRKRKVSMKSGTADCIWVCSHAMHRPCVIQRP